MAPEPVYRPPPPDRPVRRPAPVVYDPIPSRVDVPTPSETVPDDVDVAQSPEPVQPPEYTPAPVYVPEPVETQPG